LRNWWVHINKRLTMFLIPFRDKIPIHTIQCYNYLIIMFFCDEIQSKHTTENPVMFSGNVLSYFFVEYQ
jgi:hypothetical protein